MLLTQLVTNPAIFILFIIAILASITVHEFMHAWTANYLGDDTARVMGRVTLNPIAHIDPFGFIMLLIFGFGWAKPVPINPLRFKNHRLGDIVVSLAGPLANLLMAVVFSLIYRLGKGGGDVFTTFVYIMILLNVRLMIFNLLPIPPLDGSHIIGAFIKDRRFLMAFEGYGLIILIPLIFIFGSTILIPASDFIIKILLGS